MPSSNEGMASQSHATDDEKSREALKSILGTEKFLDFVNATLITGKKCLLNTRKISTDKILKTLSENQEFRRKMKFEGDQVLNVLQVILSYAATNKKIVNYGDDEKVDLLSELNNILLDRANKNLDVMEGIGEAEIEEVNPSAEVREISGSWNESFKRSSAMSTRDSNRNKPGVPSVVTLHTARVVVRPQMFFTDKIDNSKNPWCPRLKEKPNSLKPLAILLELDDYGRECFSQPYEFELDRWEPKDKQLLAASIAKPPPIENSPCVYVDTPEALEGMMSDLSKHTMLAVDLEHHSFRSFLGFSCLIQISTTEKDYIIDALKLREELVVLNEIFTKPTVLKVFHGADADIEWLQKDFSVYVVNMFDTYQAAKVINFPRLNLSFLLQHYCKISADKAYQLYDWRTRPLNTEALKYAREDTHYLLYIYSKMANELLEMGQGSPHLLQSVYAKSTLTCKKSFSKPIFDDESYLNLYRKGRKMFDNKQLHAFKELYKWRDAIAREEDESIGYVLPNHMMMQICEHLPREMQGILGCCNPVPPLVRQNLLEIHRILLAARDQPLVKAVPVTEDAHQPLVLQLERASLTDFHHKVEFRDDLPTLLDGTLPEIEDPPEVTPFLPISNEEHSLSFYLKKRSKVPKSITPFERYKNVLPYINRLEEEERLRKKREAAELAKFKEREKQTEEDLGGSTGVIMITSTKTPKAGTLSDQAKAQKRKTDEGKPTSSESVSEAKKLKIKEESDSGRAEPPSRPNTFQRGRGGRGGRGKPHAGPPLGGNHFLNRVLRKEHDKVGQRSWKRNQPDGEAPVLNLQLNTTTGRGQSSSDNPYKFVNYNKFQSRSDQSGGGGRSEGNSRSRGKRKHGGNNFHGSNKRNKW